jgi:asparagine synthetase B (glutamine-hydrolysing)
MHQELPRVSWIVTSEECPIRKLSDQLSQTHPLSVAADGLLYSLNKSVQTRVQTFSRTLVKKMQQEAGETCPRANIAVLFSGGIDSTVVAYLADR